MFNTRLPFHRSLLLQSVLCTLVFLMNGLPLQAENALVGYLPYWNGLDSKKLDLLTDLVVFHADMRADGTLKVPEPAAAILKQAKANRPSGLKTYACIGGWGQSEHFPAVTRDPALRKTFLTHLAEVVKTYQLDGIDYDWEHPSGPEEWEAYSTLIRETHDAGIRVSIATAFGLPFPKGFFDGLDRVNLMAYDLGGKGPHSTLEQARADVVRMIQRGCPPEIICLGVPFYARHGERRNETRTYASFGDRALDGTVDEIDGFYFNNTETLKKKVDMVRELNLAGIMIWEIQSDSPDLRLMRALHEALSIQPDDSP